MYHFPIIGIPLVKEMCTVPKKVFLLCQIKRGNLYLCIQLELSYSLCVLLKLSMLDPYAKENYRDMLGFWTIKYWKYCKHSHIFPKKHPHQLIKRQSDQVICFMKLNHGQVPAMVRFYLSPPPLVYPYYSVSMLTCKGIPFPTNRK